jgi:hypothetical protein
VPVSDVPGSYVPDDYAPDGYDDLIRGGCGDGLFSFNRYGHDDPFGGITQTLLRATTSYKEARYLAFDPTPEAGSAVSSWDGPHQTAMPMTTMGPKVRPQG